MMRVIDGMCVRLHDNMWMLLRVTGCTALVVFILSCTLFLSPFAPIASAHTLTMKQIQTPKRVLHIQAGSGQITGQLQDGTNKNAPLAGQKVTLQVAQGTDSSDLATVMTNSHGMYTFGKLSTDKTLSYAVYMLYQGGQYTSNVVTLDTKASQTVNLTVYESTSSTSDLVVLQATLLVRQPDAQHGLLTISEIFFYRNLGARAFVGSFDTSNGKHLPNALRFSLPGSAKAVTLGTGFAGYQTAQVDLGFATNAAIPPGESQFSFSFQIPYSAATYDFSYTVVYPTLQLSFLVPTEIHADSGFLTSGGVITTDQHPYQMFQGSQLTIDNQVHVQLQGLPLPTTNNGATSFNAKTIWLIVAGLVLLAIAIATWYLLTTQRPHQKGRGGRGKAKATSGMKGSSAKAIPASTSTNEEQRSTKREALLQELLALDTSFEAGKLSKTAYQERRAKTKARLRVIMREHQATREVSRR